MQEIANDILRKAARGDGDAFQHIYKVTSGFVYGTALRITGNTADAEEVTQDVFLKVYHNLKKFTVGTSFKAWVYRITFNTAINAYKKRARETMKQDDFDTVMAKESVASTTDKMIEKEHRKKRLCTLLKVLNPDQKACIILREIEGLHYKEIANILKININTVRSRLKRAREILMQYGRGKVIPNEV